MKLPSLIPAGFFAGGILLALHQQPFGPSIYHPLVITIWLTITLGAILLGALFLRGNFLPRDWSNARSRKTWRAR
jgi:hypothetical protein